MTVPALTVAMSVYNNGPYVAQAIESILAQSAGNFEFLIVDDGSNDGSGEIIEAYGARDARIRVIRQENRGLVASLNRLLEEARAPLVARMDGDDICLPDRFEKQLAFLARHPDHGVVGTYSNFIGADGRPHLLQPQPKPLTHEALVANFGSGPLLNHNSVVYRRDLVRSVGGYRPAYRYCEDLDLWLRLSTHTRMANLPDPLILYRRSPDQVSSRHVVEQAYNANVALAAHEERTAGRPDPTDGLLALPPIDRLDELFARPGLERFVRRQMVCAYLYDIRALSEEGYPTLLAHIRDGVTTDAKALWRAAVRLARHGRFRPAAGLAWALARN